MLGHITHALAPAVLEYVPVGHKTHVFGLVAPTAPEYAPAGHGTHVFELFAPVAPEYVPATQLRHALAPAAEYFPAGHKIHTAEELAPAVPEYCPDRQLTHAPVPVTVLYCPAGHAVHGPPFGPVYPASHTQLVSSPLFAGAREFTGHRLQFALPSGDHWPSGHGRHVSLTVAPKFSEYSPTEQLEHAERPSWLFHVP